MISDQICKKLGVRKIGAHAEWERHGRGVGLKRNQQLLDEHNDIVCCELSYEPSFAKIG